MSRLGARSSIVAGLLAGIAAAVVLIAGVVAFAPEPVAPPPTPAALPTAPVGTPTAAPSLAAPTIDTNASPEASTPTGSSLRAGEPAPRLVVAQVGGGTIDLARLHGKPVWVAFVTTECGPCRDEVPLMNDFAARYADEGLVVLAIDVGEEEGAVAAVARQLEATFPFGLDSDGHAADAWGAVDLPVHFWIDAEGIVRDGSLGGIGADRMAAGLQSIMPGADVEP